jgi:hypothetical protein
MNVAYLLHTRVATNTTLELASGMEWIQAVFFSRYSITRSEVKKTLGLV